MSASQCFGFFVESLSRGGQIDPASSADEPAGESLPDARQLESWLELPQSPARVSVCEGRVVVTPLSAEQFSDEKATSAWENGVILETIRHERQPYLAMLTAPGGEVRVNGVAAPPAGVLRLRDQVELGDDYLLHVSQFSRPYRGPAATDHVGRDCPLCLTPIVAETAVFVCPTCQTALHAQGDETPAADRLECHLSSSTCPCCGSPLIREEGFSYVPEY